MIHQRCTFSKPVFGDGSDWHSMGQDNWQFQVMDCDSSATSTLNILDVTATTGQNISTSTDILLFGSMTAGDLVVSLFLFLIILIECGKIVVRGLSGFRVHKKYLGYSGGDVEIFHDV